MSLKFYTVKEVAQILRKSEYTIRKWLRLKDLKGKKVGDGWLVSSRDLSEFLRYR